ncbi:SPOR domain-containing protein [Sedimenticola sp.]|uniref:SPOR domain-containing protein n=1 Tax=Sedimenticola sp. TaxID=1940285 RepID=UPI003D0990ED
MDALNLTKKDFRYLLAASATLPVICFVAGLYVATQIRSESMPLSPTNYIATVQTHEGVANQPAPPPDPLLSADADEQRTQATAMPDVAAKPDLQPNRFIVQAGLFSNRANAEHLLATLNQRQIQAHLLDRQEAVLQVYRVILGSFDSREAAIQHAKKMLTDHHIALYVAELSNDVKPGLVASL